MLIAGGYGYGNIGDEAQLAANIQHWRMAVPDAQITVLTPNLNYTQKTHAGVHTRLAPRIAFFGRGGRMYFGDETTFKKLFFPMAGLLLFNARLMRAGLPLFGITARQASLLDAIQNADIVFLSGGGYLTGMTLTRLWDNMLLIRLAHLLGVPTVLSGQTIGIFKDRTSRNLARWGLKKAHKIYLRDAEGSPEALGSLGIDAASYECTFDDALYYKVASEAAPREALQQSGIDPAKPYMSVNVHYWGQAPEVSREAMRQIAHALDAINSTCAVQIAFVPMVSTDETAIREVMENMRRPSVMVDHKYDMDAAIGAIRLAALCLTMKHHPIIFAMGGGVPTAAIAFDDYYHHKNRGALKLFGMENCIVQCAPEQLGDAVQQKVLSLHENHHELQAKIAETYNRLEKDAGKAVYVWARQHAVRNG